MTEDMINSPSHYTAGGIEPIEVLRAKLTAEQYEGYLLGTALVYMLRANFKGQMALDLEKAEWYSKKLASHKRETTEKPSEIEEIISQQRAEYQKLVLEKETHQYDDAEPVTLRASGERIFELAEEQAIKREFGEGILAPQLAKTHQCTEADIYRIVGEQEASAPEQKKRKPKKIFTPEEVADIKARLRAGERPAYLVRLFDSSESAIWRVVQQQRTEDRIAAQKPIKPKTAPSSPEKEYYFAGETVRIKPHTHNTLKEQFPTLNMDEEYVYYDQTYFKEHPPQGENKWFWTMKGGLTKKAAMIAAERQA
jgi:hypothetical protein